MASPEPPLVENPGKAVQENRLSGSSPYPRNLELSID